MRRPDPRIHAQLPLALTALTPPPHQAWFRRLQSRIMRMDWSWNRPALQYIDLYYAATKK
jgi:glycogen synthase